MICEARRFIGYSGACLRKALDLPFAPFPGLVVREGRYGSFTIREVVVDGDKVVVYGDPIMFAVGAEEIVQAGLGWEREDLQ